MGQAHLLMKSPQIQTEKGYGPKLKNIKPKMAQRCSRGQFSPWPTQSSLKKREKRGKGKLGRRSKISWVSYLYYPPQIRLCT